MSIPLSFPKNAITKSRPFASRLSAIAINFDGRRYFSLKSDDAVTLQATSTVPTILSPETRISRTLYRQFLRWCQHGEKLGFPDYVQRYIIHPQYLEAPEEVDAYRLELLHAASNSTPLDSSSNGDAAVAQKVLSMLPSKAEITRRSMTVPLQSFGDARGFVRAIFRLNRVALPDAKDDAVAHEAQLGYQKRRRDEAFQALKDLNQLQAGDIQNLQLSHDKHFNRDGVKYRIGEVVQHKSNRWRGVIVTWEKQGESAMSSSQRQLNYDLSKTSLTTKAYEKDDGESEVDAHAKYTVLLDVGDAQTMGYLASATAGWTSAPESDLVRVCDASLCRIRSKLVKESFDRFDAETRRFVPCGVKAYEYPSDFDQALLQKQPPKEFAQLCQAIIAGTRDFALRLDSLLKETAKDSTVTQSLLLFSQLQKQLHDIIDGDVRPTNLKFEQLSDSTLAAFHLYHLHELCVAVFESVSQRRISLASKDKAQFNLGDIVQHKKYGFRGVVIAWDPKPSIDVTKWDGLQDIANPQDIPFYQVVPYQNDCIQAFGAERSLKYVCEANLEACPSDKRVFDVDLPSDWKLEANGSAYSVPVGSKFKYGEDLGDSGLFERCMFRIKEEINDFQCQAKDGAEDNPLHGELSVSMLYQYLRQTETVEDAIATQDIIKEFQKGNQNNELRAELESGLLKLISGKGSEARAIYQCVVAKDPSYSEAWNKLATCEFLLGKYNEAIESSKKALELEPQHFQAWSGLGLVYFEKKDFREAAHCFRKSLEIDPWSPASSKLSMCLDLLDQTVQEDELP
jgi:hemimethylated DNA binding protein